MTPFQAHVVIFFLGTITGLLFGLVIIIAEKL